MTSPLSPPPVSPPVTETFVMLPPDRWTSVWPLLHVELSRYSAAAGWCPTGGRRTVDGVLPPIENRDPGDETDED